MGVIETDLYRELLQNDISIFSKAAFLAQQSTYRTYKIGVILASGKHIVSGAYSSVTSTTHYEYHVEHTILNLVSPKIADRFTMYIARLGKDGERLPSRPCNWCMKEIKKKGIKTIVYSSDFRNRIVKELL